MVTNSRLEPVRWHSQERHLSLSLINIVQSREGGRRESTPQSFSDLHKRTVTPGSIHILHVCMHTCAHTIIMHKQLLKIIQQANNIGQ